MLGLSITNHNIRGLFGALLLDRKFTSVNREASMTGLTGKTTIEIVGANFIADTDHIFGEVNWDYVKREEEWYNSKSLNVNDIPGGTPQIWKAVADKDGFINSNYGWAIYSNENFSRRPDRGGSALPEDIQYDGVFPIAACQYDAALQELKKNPESRRALMIYTRPSMWLDYNKNGRSDFMCTNAVQYLVRDGALHAVVQMRSNDAWAGFRNDRAWQKHVLEKLSHDLSIPEGNIYWQVGSLHIYEAQYYLVDHYNRTGETHITKKQYRELYPDSEFAN